MPHARERMELRALDAYAACGGSGSTTARTCAHAQRAPPSAPQGSSIAGWAGRAGDEPRPCSALQARHCGACCARHSAQLTGTWGAQQPRLARSTRTPLICEVETPITITCRIMSDTQQGRRSAWHRRRRDARAARLSHARRRLLQRVVVEAVVHEHGDQIAVLRVHDVAPQLPRAHLRAAHGSARSARGGAGEGGRVPPTGAFVTAGAG